MPLRDPDDRQPFAQMLSAMNAMLSQGGRELSPGVLRLYWEALQPYDLAAVRQALTLHLRNPDVGQHMPKPADVIRMLEGSTQDSAAIAWSTVVRAMRRIGGGPDVVFADPVIHRVIDDLGGWVKLCATLESELPFRAREFEVRYRGYAMRREVPPYPALLCGHYNAANRSAGWGHRCDPPMLVGDPEACARVMRVGVGGADRLLPIRQALSLSSGAPALADG